MISKVLRRKKGQRSSYVRLVRYLMNPQNKLERVLGFSVTNCHSDNPMVAALEVTNVQRFNRRSRVDKTYHFMFSFRAGEIPEQSALRDCEEELCSALGFAEHQRVSVIHHDTNNLHVHVAVNKVHPTRHIVHTPRLDWRTHGEICGVLETRHGFQVDRHKRRDDAAAPRGRAADMEHQAGVESLVGWIQRVASADLRGAESWAQLHQVAAKHGLEVRLRGAGCVIAQGDLAVRASSVTRELALSALESRLGAFEPAPRVLGRAEWLAQERSKPREADDIARAAAGGDAQSVPARSAVAASAPSDHDRSRPAMPPHAARLSAGTDNVLVEFERETLSLKELERVHASRALELHAAAIRQLTEGADRDRLRTGSPARLSPRHSPLAPYLDEWERVLAQVSQAADNARRTAPRANLEQGLREPQNSRARQVPPPHLRDHLRPLAAAMDGAVVQPEQHRAHARRARLAEHTRIAGTRSDPARATRIGARNAPPPDARGGLRELSTLIDGSASTSAELYLDDWERTLAQVSRDADRYLASQRDSFELSLDTTPVAETGRAGSESYQPRPLARTDRAERLYEQYLADRAARQVRRQERAAAKVDSRQRDIDRVYRRAARRRAAIKLLGGSGGEKRAMYALAHWTTKLELKSVRQRHASSKHAAVALDERRLTWNEWLQELARAGDRTAIETLRERSTAAQATQRDVVEFGRLTGRTGGAIADVERLGDVDAVTKTGTVIYRGDVAGVRADAESLLFGRRVSADVIANGLAAAIEHFGPAIRVHGEPAFKRAVVRAAVQHRMNVRFENVDLEIERATQLQQENNDERRRTPGAVRTPQPSTGAAASSGRTTTAEDGLRDLRVLDVVSHADVGQVLLREDVPYDLSGGPGEARDRLRRSADAAAGLTQSGPRASVPPPPPPAAREQLRPLSHAPALSELGGFSHEEPVRRSARSAPAEAAVRYVAEREGKRTRGLQGVLPHKLFDGVARDGVFAGRRTVNGQPLVLLQVDGEIIVVGASVPDELRIGDRLRVRADGTLERRHARSRQ